MWRRGNLLGWLLAAPTLLAGAPTPAANAGFDAYVRSVEAKLDERHRSASRFAEGATAGGVRIEQVLMRHSDLPGALIHHWRGSAFVPGASADAMEHLLRDFDSYPRYFAPQVLRAQILADKGDSMQASMRVRQKHVITVVLDATYDIQFGCLDPQHRYSISRSRRIAEVDAPGTARERTLEPDADHGFLWRLNTYWTYAERDGGLAVEIEAVSLTRSVPVGLGWIIGPYIQSIPRESLEFTLQSAIHVLKGQSQ